MNDHKFEQKTTLYSASHKNLRKFNVFLSICGTLHHSLEFPRCCFVVLFGFVVIPFIHLGVIWILGQMQMMVMINTYIEVKFDFWPMSIFDCGERQINGILHVLWALKLEIYSNPSSVQMHEYWLVHIFFSFFREREEFKMTKFERLCFHIALEIIFEHEM